MHPKVSTEEEDVTLVANFAIDPEFDFEEDCNCYYCGVEECNAPCKVCKLSLCSDCSTTPGCTCMLADDEYVEIDCFTPNPGQSKRTTYSKAQRKKVARGHETVTQQDYAMWATLTGKPILSSAKKLSLIHI